jgi:hypothetical protein
MIEKEKIEKNIYWKNSGKLKGATFYFFNIGLSRDLTEKEINSSEIIREYLKL